MSAEMLNSMMKLHQSTSNPRENRTFLCDLEASLKSMVSSGKNKKESQPLSQTVIAVFGGMDANEHQCDIEYYNMKDEKWKQRFGVQRSSFTCPQPSMAHPIGGHCVVLVQNDIYILGGRCPYNFYSNVCKYNRLTGRWILRSPMHEQRTYFYAAVIGKRIYVVGGKANSRFCWVDAHYSAAYYDSEADDWHSIASLNRRRRKLAGAIVAGKLYAIGGFPHSGTAEVYTPQTNTWKFIRNMLHRRLGATAAQLDGRIYVVGGEYALNSTEYYEPQVDTWTEVAKTFQPRELSCAVVHNGILFVIGGTKEKSMYTMEMYNRQKNDWFMITDHMHRRRGASAALVISTSIL